MRKSDHISELAKALSLAQGEIAGAFKDSQNPFFKSNYADLQSVMQAVRAPFLKNGLSVSQGVAKLGDQWVLTTVLMHSSGQWLESDTPLLYEKPTAQAVGSAISYCRRYALSAIAGVYQTDDDAESAVGRTAPAKAPVYPSQPAIGDGNKTIKPGTVASGAKKSFSIHELSDEELRHRLEIFDTRLTGLTTWEAQEQEEIRFLLETRRNNEAKPVNRVMRKP